MDNNQTSKLLEMLKEKTGGDNTYSDTGREKPSAINDVRSGEYMKALGSLAEPLDSYLGVPYRELNYNLAKTSGQDSGPMDYVKAIGKGLGSVGNDPQASHTGSDVADAMLPGNDNIGTKTALSTLYDTADLSSLAPEAKFGKLLGVTGKVEDVSKGAQAIKGMRGERELSKLGNVQFPARNMAEAMSVEKAASNPFVLNKIKRTNPELYNKIANEAGKTVELGSMKAPEFNEALAGQHVNLKHELPQITPEDVNTAMEYARSDSLSPQVKRAANLTTPTSSADLDAASKENNMLDILRRYGQR